MTPPSAAELAELLARAGWVRALAVRLVDERDAADDLAQDACVAALSAPGGVRSPGAWLAGALRHLARRRRRGEARRVARERAAARPEATAETSELVGQAELQARVIQAVTALDEPYRTTVLLRFFEGLSLVEIGARMGVPPSTARTRLARALERLRERLDREHGGDRAAWCAALARLAGPEVLAAAGAGTGAGVLAGALAMNAWIKGAAAAALAVVGFAGWRALDGADRAAEQVGARDAAAGAAELAAPEGPRAALAAAPAGETSERAAVAVAEAPPRAPAAEAAAPALGFAPARLEARLVDEHGRGIAGAELRARRDEAQREPTISEPAARSTAGGAVALDVPMLAPSASLVAVASAPGYATGYARTRLESGAVTHLGEIVLGPGCTLAGRVTDVGGAAVGSAVVFVQGVEARRTDPEELRRLGPGGDSEGPLHYAWVDAQGRFSLPGTAAGPARLWAHAEGFAFAWSEPLEVLPGGNAPVDLVLHPLAADDVLQGIVLSPDGEPVPFASLGIEYTQGNSQTSTGAAAGPDGRFSLTVTARVPHALAVDDPENRWASVLLAGVEPGGAELVVRFRETPALRFDVVDPAGAPVEHFQLSLMDERGYAAGSFDRLGGAWLGDHAGGTVTVPAPNQAFTVEVEAPGFESAKLGPFPAGAELPATRIELVALPGVSGRVLAGGKPVAGAELYLGQVIDDRMLHIRNGLRCRFASTGSLSRAAGHTDGEGRFRVYPASAGRHVLRAEADGRAPAELELDLDPAVRVDGLELALGAGGAIEGRVLVPPGEEAEGRILALNHGDGRGRTLRTGPDGRFRAEGLAAGDWQVLPFDEEILPDRSQSTMGPNPDPGPIEWSCEVYEGETTRFDVDLRERSAGRLLGRLALGVGAEGWTAALRRQGQASPLDTEVALDALAADGSFELLYPEPGAYRLHVLSPPGAARLELRVPLDLAPGETAWDCELPLGSIAGRMGPAPASAVHRYRFTGAEPGAEGAKPEITVRFEPSPAGDFELPFVPAGPGVLERITLERDGEKPLRQVNVRAGEELAVELP